VDKLRRISKRGIDLSANLETAVNRKKKSPHFTPDFFKTIKAKYSADLRKQWEKQEPFHYNDAANECSSCVYKDAVKVKGPNN
jgi:hypothetical protein